MREVVVSAVSGTPIPINPRDSDAVVFDTLVQRWRQRLRAVWPDRPDLVVLPEHAARPVVGNDPVQHLPPERLVDFTHSYGEKLRGFFAEQAAEHGSHVAWSGYRVDAGGVLRNSTVVFGPDGAALGTPYDKNYPTIREMERTGVRPGTEMVVVDTPVGRLAPVICFDLNFTEALERLVAKRPQIILFGSAYHGALMQPYWAYSARSWFVGAIHPPNVSEVLNPVGETVATSTNYRHHVTTTINLDYRVCHIDEHGEALDELKRRYGRKVRVHDPGRLGVVLITSEDDDLPLSEALDSVGIVDVDDYFTRSVVARDAASESSTTVTESRITNRYDTVPVAAAPSAADDYAVEDDVIGDPTQARAEAAFRIVVMGPSGSGKSVVGAALAHRLGLPFIDADDLHPTSNVEKMAAGTPLDDDDRMPWLDIVGSAIRAAEEGAVVACSALARRYRDRIRAGAPDVVFVELLVAEGELNRRMTTREHFMPAALLNSQLQTLEHLEAEEKGVVVENDSTLANVVAAAQAALGAIDEA